MIEILLLVLGLVIGSFLGALTYRLPRNVSIASGRSKCPNCHHTISWYDNLPVVSYLILGGKCRNCHKEISIRYPLIEIATAIIFLVVGLSFTALIIACILIAIFIVDWEHQIIPDELIFIGLFIFLLSINFNLTLLLPGLLSALVLLFLNLITKGKGMGMGDVKLAILVGSLVGMNFLFVWLFFSFVSGAIVGIILMTVKVATLKYKIAFGPFLIIGLVLTIYFGQNFLSLLT